MKKKKKHKKMSYIFMYTLADIVERIVFFDVSKSFIQIIQSSISTIMYYIVIKQALMASRINEVF